MEMKPVTLRKSLLGFYFRLLCVGLGASALAALAGAGWLLWKDRPVTAAAISGVLFWFGVAAAAWMVFTFTSMSSSLGWGDAVRTGSRMPTFSRLEEQHRGRTAFAWYAGAVGLTALLLSFILPAL